MPLSNNILKEVLHTNGYRIAILCVATAVFSFLIAHFTVTALYEASGTIRIGQTPYGGTPYDGTDSALLMAVPETIELMNHATYRRDVIDLTVTSGAQSTLSYRIRPLQSGHIQIKARAPSPKTATALLENAVNKLKTYHLEIFEHRVSLFSKENNPSLNEKLLYAQSQIILNRYLNEETESLTVEKLGSLVQIENYIDKLDRQRDRTEKLLNPRVNYSTNLIDSTTVTAHPVYPSWILLAIFSLFIGALFSIFYIGSAIYLRKKSKIT